MDLKKRFAGHSLLNNVIRKDWQLAIELSLDSYQALLYKPKSKDWYNEEQHDYEADLVTEIDSNQDDLEYDLPTVVYVVDCPDESPFFMEMSQGNVNLGDYATPLSLRIATDEVPVGSVLEWEEEISDHEHRRCWWYVYSQQGLGTENVGTLYVCIPARNFDSMAIDNDRVLDSEDLGYQTGFSLLGFDKAKDENKLLNGLDLGYDLNPYDNDRWGDDDDNDLAFPLLTDRGTNNDNTNRNVESDLSNDRKSLINGLDLGYELDKQLGQKNERE